MKRIIISSIAALVLALGALFILSPTQATGPDKCYTAAIDATLDRMLADGDARNAAVEMGDVA